MPLYHVHHPVHVSGAGGTFVGIVVAVTVVVVEDGTLGNHNFVLIDSGHSDPIKTLILENGQTVLKIVS